MGAPRRIALQLFVVVALAACALVGAILHIGYVAGQRSASSADFKTATDNFSNWLPSSIGSLTAAESAVVQHRDVLEAAASASSGSDPLTAAAGIVVKRLDAEPAQVPEAAQPALPRAATAAVGIVAQLAEAGPPEILQAPPGVSRPVLPWTHPGEAAAAVAEGVVVHVVYSASWHGFYGMLNSMVSVVRSLVQPDRVAFHLIISKTNMHMATEVVKCFWEAAGAQGALATVSLHNVSAMSSMAQVEKGATSSASAKKQDKTKGKKKGRRMDLLTGESYVGIFMDTYLPKNISRVIWMDTDTIVLENLANMYRLPMQYALAAVPLNRTGLPASSYDYLTKSLQQLRNWKEELLNLRVSQYALWGPMFNAGIFMVDLTRWRDQGMAAQCESWIERLASIDTDTIQLPMNIVFSTSYDYLDWRWNVDLTQFPYGVRLRQASILHWVGRNKPWPRWPYADHLYELHDQSRQCEPIRSLLNEKS